MIKVLFFDATYKQQLVEFLRRVWDKDLTEANFEARLKKNMSENPFAKDGGFPIAIAVKNDQIIGHHAGTPVHLWVNGKELLSYWLAGLHVLPEGRKQGVAKALQNKTNQLPLTTSFWVIEATLRVKNALGWTVVGKIPEYIKVLDPKKLSDSIEFNKSHQLRLDRKQAIQKLFLDKNSPGNFLFKSIINIQNFVYSAFLSRRAMQYRISQVQHFDIRIDQLWERNQNSLKFAQVRKSDYLNWQFKHESGWIKIIAENDSGIAGYAILSLKKIQKVNYFMGVRALSIIDIFWDFTQPEAYWDLLRYVQNMGIENNATALICSINNKQARSILKRNGYFRIPGTVYFGFHCNDPKLSLSPNMNDWFITRGDGDAAGSLGPNKTAGDKNAR